MDRDTFERTLRACRDHKPFRRFVVVMVDGAQHKVDRTDALAMRDGTGVFLSLGGVPNVFAHDTVTEIITDAREQSAKSG